MINNCLAVVRNIKVLCTFEDDDALDAKAIKLAEGKFKSCGLNYALNENRPFVYKKSVDARKKDQIYLVYSVAIAVPSKALEQSFSGVDVIKCGRPEFCGKLRRNSKPVVVGFGPSGMFCALALAKAGLCPVVIERGADIDSRTVSVNEYWTNGKLDKRTNVQFGEGGAGTFSDGKLLTRISDELINFVLEEFVVHGAPQKIRYEAKPHIGTDNLRNIVKNIRNEIISLGGIVSFLSELTDIKLDSAGSIKGIVINDSDSVECDALFLCIGHSARDTVSMLRSHGVLVEPKPFSVGARIEHLQDDIDASLYGRFAGAPSLSKAQYTLSRKLGNRAVYSFCMCPGGVVVASASDDGEIVTNGMSYYARDGRNANSAIAVSVNPEDYGGTVEGAVGFQQSIENAAFRIAGNDGTAPIQTLGSLLKGSLTEPSRIVPTYTGKVVVCDINKVFPEFVVDHLKRGIKMFEYDIKGFSCDDAVLTFPETRTSSPVRIVRDVSYCARGMTNMYPCGEGAGYAGGITSAAVDGLRSALAFLNCKADD